jgi:hypothetical protein
VQSCVLVRVCCGGRCHTRALHDLAVDSLDRPLLLAAAVRPHHRVLTALEGQLQHGHEELGEFQRDWQRVADSEHFSFKKTTVSIGMWAHFVNNYFVCSMSNEKVEGLFNIMDIYGDVQLDPVRQEYIMVYVAGVLERDRRKRRSAKFRVKPGEAKDQGASLRKHAWNKAQLAALGQSGLDRALLITDQQRTQVCLQSCLW